MSKQSRLESLESRHDALERKLDALMAHPGAGDHEISKLKRQKLAVKDEISRLSTGDAEGAE